VDGFGSSAARIPRWSDGSYPLLKRSERVEIQLQTQLHDNYLSQSVLLYPEISWDDGTAKTEEVEFGEDLQIGSNDHSHQQIHYPSGFIRHGEKNEWGGEVAGNC